MGVDVSLARSALWLLVAKSAGFALSVAVPLVLVRQLTIREFGVYKQLFLLVDTATTILPLGFALSAFYFFPREPARKAHVVGNIIRVYALVASLGGLLAVVFPALPAAVLNSHDLAAYAGAIGAATLLCVGSSFVESVAIANGEAKLAAFVILAMQLTRSILLVVAGGLFGSIRSLANAAVIYGFLQSSVMLWYVRSRFSHAGWQSDWSLMRAQIAYAMPLAYAGLLWWLQLNVHNYFVSHQFGAAAYAVYAVGCFQLPIMGIILESVGSVVIRRVNELRSRNETREILRLGAGTARTLAAVALPLYALLLVTGHEVLTVLFTVKYRASWPIFAVNLSTIPLAMIAPICDAVFRAFPEHLPFLLKVRTALMTLLLGGLWIATQRIGLVGTITLVVGVTLVERVLIAIRVGHVLGMTWTDLSLFGDVAKLGVAAGLAGVATRVVREVLVGTGHSPLASLAICASVFGCIYVTTVLLLRVPTPAERERIRQALVRVHRIMSWRNSAETPEHGGA